VLEIVRVANKYGYTIDKYSNKKPYDRFEAVAIIEKLVERIGLNGWEEILKVGKLWKGQPMTNQPKWLTGLGVLVRDFEVHKIARPGALSRIVPAEAIAETATEVLIQNIYKKSHANDITSVEARILAAILAKTGRIPMKPLP
jgi:hypothetical protein